MKRIKIMRKTVLFLCATLIAVFLSTRADGKPAKTGTVGISAAEKPNVVLIVIESLRKDHVGCYGYSRNTTPSIDAFAKKAVRFTNAVSTSSWTIPSHMSIFTGLYPGVHRVRNLPDALDTKVPTLAEILKNAGFYTTGIVSNPTLNSMCGYGRGFNLYDDCSVFDTLERTYVPHELLEQNRIRPGDSQRFFFNGMSYKYMVSSPTSAILNQIVFRWLKAHHREQFFLFLHYFDPHYDYCRAPLPYNTMFDPNYRGSADGRNMMKTASLPERDLEHVKALYDGDIRYTDKHIGLLLREMGRYGLTDKTLFIILADHGEEFYDHGGFTHGFTLYGEVTHIPYIIKFPGQTESQVVSSLASEVDILPTVCDYLNIKPPEVVQGRSLLPLVYGKKKEVHTYVFSELDSVMTPHLKAVETREYRLIKDLGRNRTELFSMKNDPLELKNLYHKGMLFSVGEKGRVARGMRKELERFMKLNIKLSAAIGDVSSKKVTLDEKTRERLKSLGYIQ